MAVVGTRRPAVARRKPGSFRSLLRSRSTGRELGKVLAAAADEGRKLRGHAVVARRKLGGVARDHRQARPTNPALVGYRLRRRRQDHQPAHPGALFDCPRQGGQVRRVRTVLGDRTAARRIRPCDHGRRQEGPQRCDLRCPGGGADRGAVRQGATFLRLRPSRAQRTERQPPSRDRRARRGIGPPGATRLGKWRER